MNKLEFTDVLWHKGRHRGRTSYEMLPAYWTASPKWAKAAAAGLASGTGEARLTFPPLAWIDELVERIAENSPTCVAILPGSGPEQVQTVIEKLASRRVFLVDFGLLDSLAQTEVRPESLEVARMAPAVGTENAGPVLLVEGFGEHARRFGKVSLEELARCTLRFATDRNYLPVLSSNPLEHIVNVPKRGSPWLTRFVRVGPSALDSAQIAEWALTRFARPQKDRAVLVEAAKGQLGVAIAVLRSSPSRPLSELLEEIRVAHRESAEGILNSFGECCYKVLIGETNERCTRLLVDCGILIASPNGTTPRIDAWAARWRNVGGHQ